MVSLVWAAIAFSLGLLVYLGAPAVGGLLPIRLRRSVGRFYFDLSMRSYQKVALLRRLLGGYELLPISVDDEQKVAEVTLSSGLVSDDKTLPFKDPDKRLMRLHSKPMAMLVEDVPAAVDAELAEIGYWLRRHETEKSLEHGDRIMPYVEMSPDLRVSEPLDTLNIVSNGVQPETVKTTEELTKERFAEYGSNIGMAETIGTITGFAVGIGAVAGMQYISDNLLDGSSSAGDTVIGIGYIDLTPVLEVVLWI